MLLSYDKDICVHQPLLLRAGFQHGRTELGVGLFTNSYWDLSFFLDDEETTEYK